MAVKILAFAGSTRLGSFNKKLLSQAVAAASHQGVHVTHIDLKDFPLPLYDGDLEESAGLPESAKRLKALFMDHQGLLLACPEYNSSISGVLKNTLDWVSRPAPDEAEYLICFKNKVAALMSASPGELGGLRGLVVVRSMLENVGTMVLPSQLTLPKANEKFDQNGLLLDAKKSENIHHLVQALTQTLTKLYA
ncbi:MAG TPA: NAD(P)H-dependent oxidoreductase [Chlamydiales bacterium]|nr:NAD(P)H-dependent oxidoreductase [Chlamydiales bacterium]HPE85489.1 NAD(P)H-dependent oxidoreductase [Chlamydiales bacterium]